MAGEFGVAGVDAGDSGEGGFGGLCGHPGEAGHVADDDTVSVQRIVIPQPDLFAANSIVLEDGSCMGLREGNAAQPIEFTLMEVALFLKLE